MDIEGIDINELYPYQQAAKAIKGRRPGKAISIRTVERWRHDGLLRGGIRIRLRAIRLGNDWRTCDRWVEEFVTAMNSGNDGATTSTTPVLSRTPSQREKSSSEARQRLEKIWERRRSA